jgi:hypothetical protein
VACWDRQLLTESSRISERSSDARYRKIRGVTARGASYAGYSKRLADTLSLTVISPTVLASAI